MVVGSCAPASSQKMCFSCVVLSFSLATGQNRYFSFPEVSQQFQTYQKVLRSYSLEAIQQYASRFVGIFFLAAFRNSPVYFLQPTWVSRCALAKARQHPIFHIHAVIIILINFMLCSVVLVTLSNVPIIVGLVP